MAKKVKTAAPGALQMSAAAESPMEAAAPMPPAAEPVVKKAVKKPARKTGKPAKKAASSKTAKPIAKKAAPKPKTKTKAKPKAQAKAKKPAKAEKTETATLLSSEVTFECPLFRVQHDKLIEPGGKQNERDVIRHNGSVVILALDASKSKKDPWIVIERQYRHAANQYLWELPAGKIDAGEEALAGAKRELAEETGYAAKKWKPLVEYFASPGFLGESMKVFLAEGLIPGEAHPEGDEEIEFRLVKLSEVLRMIDKGAILDGKTLTSILLYARKIAGKHKK